MKVKVVSILVVIILIMITSTACVDLSLPIYEKTDEDGTSVIIDGVRYKQLPILNWEVYPEWGGEIIGYAGNRETIICEANGDTERNFVYIKGTFTDYYDGFLYRADKEIPEPSADSIDEMMWFDYIIGSDEQYVNTVTDESIIEALFQIIETGEKLTEYEEIEKNSEKIIMYISCSSSELPGAYYILYIGRSNGKIICGNKREKEYVEIPIELLEKISGKTFEGTLY